MVFSFPATLLISFSARQFLSSIRCEFCSWFFCCRNNIYSLVSAPMPGHVSVWTGLLVNIAETIYRLSMSPRKGCWCSTQGFAGSSLTVEMPRTRVYGVLILLGAKTRIYPFERQQRVCGKRSRWFRFVVLVQRLGLKKIDLYSSRIFIPDLAPSATTNPSYEYRAF